MTLAGASGSSSGKGDDHLGRLMIIWVGKVKTSLARQACVQGNAMIIWVCGTVGLWDSCGRLNDPSLARQACVRGTRDDHVGLWDCGTLAGV